MPAEIGPRWARAIAEHRELFEQFVATQHQPLDQLAAAITDALRHDRKLLIFGNGGSAADAQHFAAELVGRFELERRGWPAIALTVDSSALTAISNDYGYERVFARQIEALGRPGDLALGISTSGQSANVTHAIETARARGLVTAALLGRDGGVLRGLVDHRVIVPGTRTSRIQELHLFAIHLLCEAIEAELGAA
jgi:D-sedoheptulose 7-phosphate isomerase